jgi:hypothetical protein
MQQGENGLQKNVTCSTDEEKCYIFTEWDQKTKRSVETG